MIEKLNDYYTSVNNCFWLLSDDKLQAVLNRPFEGEPFNKDFDFEKFTASIILTYRRRKGERRLNE